VEKVSAHSLKEESIQHADDHTTHQQQFCDRLREYANEQ
jgi:hypothetical protein